MQSDTQCVKGVLNVNQLGCVWCGLFW